MGDGWEINEKRLVNQFCDLVRIDSPSLKERQMADEVGGILRGLGFSVFEDQAGEAIGGNCGNMYASMPGELSGPPLLFAVHLDTVEPCRGKAAMVGEDQVIRSQGTTILGADDLAGITAVLEAVRSAREQNLPCRSLELLLTVSEEIHLQGAHHLRREKLKALEAYVLDTSGQPGAAVLKAPGHIRMVFRFIGKAAHAGIAPEAGISAIMAAARGIAALNLGRVDPETTANIGRIEGGGETNIVAEECLVTAECRSLNDNQLQEQAADMQAKMEQAAQLSGARLEITATTSYLPYEVNPERPVVQRFKEACRMTGLQARLIASGGGSDNNILARHGIEGVVISCGMEDVHSCREHIRCRDLSDTARLVMALMSLP
jgi:tripeptide aminopeptidase